MKRNEHIPVLTAEVLEFLQVKAGAKYIDSTVGGGGHAEAILKKGGKVLGIDIDPISLEIARKRLEACSGTFNNKRTPSPFKLIRNNFASLKQIAVEENFNNSRGILFDLGFASFQMDNLDRGLSYSGNGPLDMRLDPNLGVTAADLLNVLPENEIKRMLETADEKRARSLSRAIVARRKLKPFATVAELRDLVLRVADTKSKINPATKTFMALRIAVNSELENLKKGLEDAVEILAPGGRILVISFHSGEDRIVKNIFRAWEQEGKTKVVTVKPLVSQAREILNNPRARSAKLRVVQKNEN